MYKTNCHAAFAAPDPMQDGGLHPPYGRPASPLHSNDVQQRNLRLNEARNRTWLKRGIRH